MGYSVKQVNGWINRGSAEFQRRYAQQFGSTKLPRVLPEGMNKSEFRYGQYLERLKRDGQILDWKFTGNLGATHGLPILTRRRYTPDFYVWMPDERLEFHEVKGFLRDGGSLRFDVAAAKYHGHVFRMVRWDRKHRVWVEIRTHNAKEG